MQSGETSGPRRASRFGAGATPLKTLIAFFRDLTLGQARALLFGAWLTGALAVCLFFAFHSLHQYQMGGPLTGWEWLLPTIGPTLALISASAVTSALERGPAEDRKLARPIAFYASLAWSVVYFTVLTAAIADPSSAFVDAATSLALMQIVLTAFLGVFLSVRHT